MQWVCLCPWDNHPWVKRHQEQSEVEGGRGGFLRLSGAQEAKQHRLNLTSKRETFHFLPPTQDSREQRDEFLEDRPFWEKDFGARVATQSRLTPRRRGPWVRPGGWPVSRVPPPLACLAGASSWYFYQEPRHQGRALAMVPSLGPKLVISVLSDVTDPW